MIRVLLVEDSLTQRQLLVEILNGDPGIRVVGEAKDGAEAVALARTLRPDLIVMDVHMPVMDGLAATKEIMVEVPTPIVLVSSSSSSLGVELALNAMRAGALLVVEKPDHPGAPDFPVRRDQLVRMAKAMSEVKVVRQHAGPPELAAPPPRAAVRGVPVRLVAVAASTGGPAVLQRILGDLPRDFAPPVLVVQHIAAGFVQGLADWLNGSSLHPVKVAEHGEPLRPRVVYLAPDDRHLGVKAPGLIELSAAPTVNGFRPSGTHLFESTARLYGPSLAAVILTGMGNDGVHGLRAVRAAGGTVLAQDEASCVVYGMPQEAIAAGVVDGVLGAVQIGARLAELVGEGS
jgi:two-component system chemotaxis response regulator CheB